MLGEHHQLRDMVKALGEFLEDPCPEPDDEECGCWVGTLSEQLVKLHVKLCKHFREEEDAHLLDQLAEKFPRASNRLQKLRGEHQQILRDLRAIVAATMSYAEGDPSPQLSQWTKDVIAQLRRHEESETALMQKLYNEEIGTGD
jgi:hypothetical protein